MKKNTAVGSSNNGSNNDKDNDAMDELMAMMKVSSDNVNQLVSAFQYQDEKFSGMMKKQDKKISVLTTQINGVDDNVASLTSRMDNFEENEPISRKQQKQLQNMGRNRIFTILGGKKSEDYQRYSGYFYKRMWGDYKKKFELTSYHDTPKKDYEEALEWLEAWNPAKGKSGLKAEYDRIQIEKKKYELRIQRSAEAELKEEGR